MYIYFSFPSVNPGKDPAKIVVTLFDVIKIKSGGGEGIEDGWPPLPIVGKVES